MILTSIKASNVLKYQDLTLSLPEKGLIAISGPNESGKSTIGETVCFALFGRTFSIGPNELDKIVRWGENHCSVVLDFQVGDKSYVLSRFLDRDNNHSAKLAHPESPDAPLARGVKGVAEALEQILGYKYEEFVESFYLAQREITTPHPHSLAVKIMAGVAPLEQVANGFNNDIDQRRELIEEIDAEAEVVEKDVKSLKIEDGYVVKLEDARYQTEQQLVQINELTEEMSERQAVYSDNSIEIKKNAGRRGRSAFLRFLLFLALVIVAGVWALLTYGAELSQAELVRTLLAEKVPQWDISKLPWLLYAAAGLGVLFLLIWMRIGGLKRRIRKLREQSGLLADTLERAREIELEIEEPEALEIEASAEATEEGEADAETDTDVLIERPEQAELDAFRDGLSVGDAAAVQVRDYTGRELAWLGYVAEQLAAQLADLDEDVANEHSRLQEAMNLTDVLVSLSDKREDVSGYIEQRNKALELLNGAIDHLSGHFNRDVKELVGRLLPLFTDNRYEHLQIDAGLMVRVFSSDKRDFMDLDEVSSGTQRQVMLALRLALSQKLLTRAVKGKQFAFLDEPFAFFDEERTHKALQALTNLGDDISQVWIVAQSFPEEERENFDQVIVCNRDNSQLVLA